MNTQIKELLDTWMISLHGNTHTDSPLIRLATFIFCSSLPKGSLDIDSNKKENSSIDILLMPSIKECTPVSFQPGNELEKLMLENKDKIKSRINLPRKFNKLEHIKGSALLMSRVNRHFGCEMQVTSTKDSHLKFDLYHTSFKRCMFFTISN